GPEGFRYRDVPWLPCSGWERDLRGTIGGLWWRDFGFDGLDGDAGCRSLDLKRPENFTKRQGAKREDLHAAISCVGHEQIVAFRNGQPAWIEELPWIVSTATDARQGDELLKATVESFDLTGSAVENVNPVLSIERNADGCLQSAKTACVIHQRPDCSRQ